MIISPPTFQAVQVEPEIPPVAVRQRPTDDGDCQKTASDNADDDVGVLHSTRLARRPEVNQKRFFHCSRSVAPVLLGRKERHIDALILGDVIQPPATHTTLSVKPLTVLTGR